MSEEEEEGKIYEDFDGEIWNTAEDGPLPEWNPPKEVKKFLDKHPPITGLSYYDLDDLDDYDQEEFCIAYNRRDLSPEEEFQYSNKLEEVREQTKDLTHDELVRLRDSVVNDLGFHWNVAAAEDINDECLAEGKMYEDILVELVKERETGKKKPRLTIDPSSNFVRDEEDRIHRTPPAAERTKTFTGRLSDSPLCSYIEEALLSCMYNPDMTEDWTIYETNTPVHLYVGVGNAITSVDNQKHLVAVWPDNTIGLLQDPSKWNLQ